MSKRIILTGGGTGGHITPLLAVAYELKRQDPSCYVIYIGERNGKFAHLTTDNPNIDESHTIFAGKFRRYHKESWLRRIFAIRTNLLNFRDAFYFILGCLQSAVLVRKLNPDMILLKGGFVGVPIGLAAALYKKPFITHDSDAVPGLANRLVSNWARYHATGMPAEYYRYPKESIRYVGVLVGKDYSLVTEKIQNQFKSQIDLAPDSELLVVTGGSHGAASINQAVRKIVGELLELHPKLTLVHQVGKHNTSIYDGFQHDRLRIFELLNPMYTYTGAADIVVSRAGANTMAELGIQGKSCIVIPNPLLTGGHQLKNAALWQERAAAVVLEESLIRNDPKRLLETISSLLADKNKRAELGKNLESLTAKGAAEKLAALLLT